MLWAGKKRFSWGGETLAAMRRARTSSDSATMRNMPLKRASRKTQRVLPSRSSSPSRKGVLDRMRRPLTKVPLRLPKSRTAKFRPCSPVIRQWTLETSTDRILMRFLGWRPITLWSARLNSLRPLGVKM